MHTKQTWRYWLLAVYVRVSYTCVFVRACVSVCRSYPLAPLPDPTHPTHRDCRRPRARLYRTSNSVFGLQYIFQPHTHTSNRTHSHARTSIYRDKRGIKYYICKFEFLRSVKFLQVDVLYLVNPGKIITERNGRRFTVLKNCGKNLEKKKYKKVEFHSSIA